MKKLRLLLTALVATAAATVNAATGITLDTASKNNVTVTNSNGEYTITTTGTDPYILTQALTAAMHIGDCRLEFQYQASADISDLQIFFMAPDASEAKSMHTDILTKSTVWKTASINIGSQRQLYSWGSAGNRLRLDFGNKSGVTVKIRYLGVNGAYDLSATEKNNRSVGIAKYLSTEFPSSVSKVDVGENQITISGVAAQDGILADFPPQADPTRLNGYTAAGNVKAGSFELTVDRYVTVGNKRYDRLLSRWAILDNSGKLCSHAHYADDVASIRKATPGVLKSKKGLGGLFGANVSDLEPLGIHCVTINFVMAEFFAMNKRDNSWTPYEYCGRTYYINKARIAQLDQQLLECDRLGIVVCAILLVSPSGGEGLYRSTMIHPEYAGGHYTMPNVTNIDGVHAYAATINYMADHFSTPGNGRVHHWIMHNEVDQHTQWTNMGSSQPMLRYVDEYEKSMRLVSNIVRQYDPNAYVLASFTSSWAQSHGNGCPAAKPMLEQIVNYSNVEGDYRWGIAAHPYPIDFFKPKFWSQDTQATYDENSGFSTFKNIEVISDWVLRREHYYKNQEKRMLFFTENGVNSLDYQTANLNVQAAGAAWAWKKTKANSGVDGIMWHNWFDNPAEDGLKLGLKDANLNPKPSWYVWQAAGTDNEESVFKPYLSTIGITDWNSIHQNVSKVGSSALRIELDKTTASGLTCSYNANSQIYTLTTSNTDPQILTVATTEAISSTANVLTFEYKADKDLDLQIFFGPPTEANSITTHIPATTQWKRMYLNIAAMRAQTGTWGNKGSQLRIDPGTASGITFSMRHLCVNSGETAAYTALGVSSSTPNQCTVSTNAGTGVTTVVTSGTDPGFYSNKLSANLLSKANKVTFEYQASADIANFTLYFCDNATEVRSVNGGTLKKATAWTKATIDISSMLKNYGWGFAGDYLRIDPGSVSGITFKMRSLAISDGSTTDDHALILDNMSSHDLSLSHDANPQTAPLSRAVAAEYSDLSYNSWVMNTTGSDPYVLSYPLTKTLAPEAGKLHIIYKSSIDITPLQLFFMEPTSETRSKTFNNVMPKATDWKHIVLDISDMRTKYGWGYPGDRLRIDFGNNIGSNIHIQSLAINSDATTGIDNINADSNSTSWTVFNTPDGILISTSVPQTFKVYNTLGVNVATVHVDNQANVHLPQGIYILNGRKIAVR